MKHNETFTQLQKNNEEVAIPSFSNVDKQFDNELYKLLSPIFTDIKDIQAILDANWLYCRKIKTIQELCLNNYYIKTCSLERLAEYEQICGISTNERLNENIRRQQVILAFNFVLPYTIAKLKEILNSTCGVGNWVLKQNIEKYQLQIQVKESYTDMVEVLQQTLYYIIPTHIQWIITKEINKNCEFKYYTGGALMLIINSHVSCDASYEPPVIEGD